MHIVIESYNEIDPRLVPEIEFLSQYADWMFEIAYVKPENVSKVDWSKINYKEVPEHIAKACRFTNCDDEFRLGILEGSAVHQDLIAQSTEKHAYKPRVYYKMTEEDKKNLVEFYKVEMNLFLNRHYATLTAEEVAKNKDFRAALEREIQSLDSVEKCKAIMHQKFGVAAFNKLVTEMNLGGTGVNVSL